MSHRIARLIRALVLCVGLGCGASTARADTILKLNLGGTGPDVSMSPAGVLATPSDGVVATTGNQNTAIEYTGGFDFIPDVPTDTASFTLTGMAAVGPPSVFGVVVIQSFSGGTFNLYDPNEVLLLSGTLSNSVLTGTVGLSGTGSIFTVTNGLVTGGTLSPLIGSNSLSMSMAFTNVNGGAGFSVGQGPVLNPFTADASIQFGATVAPEPTTALLPVLLLLARRAPRRGRKILARSRFTRE